MDFVQDAFDSGRVFRALTVVDVFTRESLAIHADASLSGSKVAQVLDGIALVVASRSKSPWTTGRSSTPRLSMLGHSVTK